jgi:hypothetical protein
VDTENVVIENAVVYVAGRAIKTRLHEHGGGEGYFDGKLEDMKALKESGLHCVDIWVGDKHKEVLVDVEWGELVDWSYDDYDHAIVHLDWNDGSEDYEYARRRRRLQKELADVRSRQVPGVQVDQNQAR